MQGTNTQLSSTEDPLTSTWQCKLPVRVRLAPNSISSPAALPPFYLLIPRQSYVSSISTQIWPLVQHVLPKLPGNVLPRPWFDFDGVPLKSTLPVGVLFDLLTASTPGPSSSPLPWHLTLHYTHAPPEASVSWLASLPPHTLFMNSLKEACHICKGADGSAAVMRMEGAAQDALWAAVEKCDVAQYISFLGSLKVVPSPRSQGTGPASIPVRLLLRQPHAHPPTQPGGDAPQAATVETGIWDDIVCTSRPVPAFTASGTWTTLGDLLHAMLPMLFSQPMPPAVDVTGPALLQELTPDTTQPESSGNSKAADEAVVGDGPQHAAANAEGTTAEAGQTSAVSDAALDEGAGEPRSLGLDQAQSAAMPSQEQESLPAGEGQVSLDLRASEATGSESLAASIILTPPPGPGGPTGPQGPSDASLQGHQEAAQAQLTIPLTTNLTGPRRDASLADNVPGMEAQGSAGCQWCVCGVQPPLSTPIAWLHAHMHAPDYFLYIVVRADGQMPAT